MENHMLHFICSYMEFRSDNIMLTHYTCFHSLYKTNESRIHIRNHNTLELKLTIVITLIMAATTPVNAARSKLCSKQICSKCAQIAQRGIGGISVQRSCDLILRTPRCCNVRSYRLLWKLTNKVKIANCIRIIIFH